MQGQQFLNRVEATEHVPSPVQCRIVRAALRIGIRELAASAYTTPKTLCRFENGYDVHPATQRNLQGVLEQAGMFFAPPSMD
jgi:hypothetical protein